MTQPLPFRRAAPLLLSLVLAISATAQEPVARVKSAPQDYRGRAAELEGEVFEVRALSPRSRQGIYRLVDSTDPLGILIRTADLPQGGGPFRVRAFLSPEVLSQGQLLLDELSRESPGSSTLPMALAVAGLGLAVAFWASFLYIQARRHERQIRLAPPIWLIPGGAGSAYPTPAAPAPRFDYKLQEVEEARSRRVEARRRQALQILAPGLLVAIGGSIWAGVAWQAAASQPTFTLIGPEAAGPPRSPGATRTITPGPDDTLRVAIRTPPMTLPAVFATDTTRRRRLRRDTAIVSNPNPITTIEPLAIATSTLQGGTVGLAYNALLAANGGITPYTWEISAGDLPAGVTLNAGTGALSGMPTTAGSATFTVQATDAGTPRQTATLEFTIMIEPALTITTPSLPGGIIGIAYSSSVAAANGTAPYTWALASGSGPLPTGLSLATDGSITGTPSTAGNFSLTVQVTDATTPTAFTATKTLSITIVAAPPP